MVTIMTADAFITALRILERERDVEPLAALYADDACCGNVATSRSFTGPDGAREFWTSYRETFDEVESEFRIAVEDEDAVALEWVSTGTLAGGEEIRYEGVTIVALADDKITRSTAYFDPRAVLRTVAA